MCDISEPALSKALTKVKDMTTYVSGQVDTARCDVSKEEDVEACVSKLDEWGGVDIMFNNAGIMHADDAGKSHHPQCLFHIPSH